VTERFKKIAVLRNEIEALCLRGDLEARGVPHMIQSYYDLAYDGLFQATRGWGHVAAPVERADEILEILDAIRERSAQQTDEVDEEREDERGG
jgi:hypothetical protein